MPDIHSLCIRTTALFLALIATPVLAQGDGETPAEPGGVYVDEYFAGDEIEAIDTDAAAADDGPPRRYSMATRTFVDARDGIQPLRELGLDFNYQRSSLSHGDFSAQLTRVFSTGGDFTDATGEFLKLDLQNFAIDERFNLDGSLGHLRTAYAPVLASSYRFFLPATYIQGARAHVHDGRSGLMVTAGHIGTLVGNATRSFSRGDGSLIGASVHHDWSPRWHTAAEIWRTERELRPGEDVDHAAVGTAVEFKPSPTAVHQLRFVRDTNGQFGTWYDGDGRFGRWRHNYGAYHFEPGLRWTDTQINNDRQGAFWRGNYASARWRWTLGSEIERNNLDNRPARDGTITTLNFANGSFRYRRRTQFGALVSLRTTHDDSGTARNDGHTIDSRWFLTHDFPFGLSRFEWRLSNENGPVDEVARTRFRWDHDWRLEWAERLTTEFQITRDTDEAQEIFASAITERSFRPDLVGRLNLQVVDRRDADRSESIALNWSAGGYWAPHRDLRFTLSANSSIARLESARGPRQTVRDLTVLVTLEFQRAVGRVPQVLGIQTDSNAAGRIRGRVFLDENRNGRFDPSERAVPRITVYLDGRYPMQTDGAGEYEFDPVATGEHWIRLAVDEAPLPWGLDDEGPQSVIVPVRGQVRHDIGLTRIGE